MHDLSSTWSKCSDITNCYLCGSPTDGYKETKNGKYIPTISGEYAYIKNVGVSNKMLCRTCYNSITPLRDPQTKHLTGCLTLDIPDVLSLVPYKARTPIDDYAPLQHTFGQYTVCLNTRKLVTFKHHGTSCYMCGLKGEYFLINVKKYVPFLELYAVDHDGVRVPMVASHKSKGGYETVTMCAHCNNLKGNMILLYVR